MNSKTILGISIAAIFAISMVTIQAVADPLPGHLDIKTAKITAKGNNAVMKISLVGDVNSGIDPITNEGFYGYAALTNDGTGILAVTYHEPIVDSNDQPGWHTHFVDVSAPSTNCISGIEVASVTADGPGNLIIGKKNVVVNQVPIDQAGTFTGQVISLELTVEGSSVCVNPIDSN